MTVLESQVMEVLGKPNGNGENIRFNDYHRDYESLFDFGMETKILRGVLSSLIKKGLIEVYEEEFGSMIELTANGIAYYQK